VSTLESLVTRLSLSGLAAGVVLMTVSATATTAAVPPLRTAPFTPRPTHSVPTPAVPTDAATTLARTAPLATTTVAVVSAGAPVPTAPSSPSSPSSPPSPPAPTAPPPSPVERVVTLALAQRGRPYVHGGAGPDAYDCSGLTMMAYRAAGIDLPHYSVSQAQRGEAVDWRRQPIRAGDLVFMRGDNPVIDLGHVGLAISPTEWVVASRPGTPVRVAPIPRAAIQRVRRLLP
jgi:cell wall-associated NlpC family hydrolase